jgi:hypothetical protein
MAFYVKPKSGFTARLARMASSGSSNPIPVLLDGPYGGPPTSSLMGYEQVLLIAGGSGAGFLLPLVEDLIRCTCHIEDSIRMKVQLVLAVRKAEEAGWFSAAVGEMLHGDVCFCNIHISVYITGDATMSFPIKGEENIDTKSSLPRDEKTDASNPAVKTVRDPKEKSGVFDDKTNSAALSAQQDKNHSHGTTSEEANETSRIITSYSYSGRPNLPNIINTSVASHNSLGIVACGPSSMLYDVRNSVASAQFGKGKGKDVYLHTESFSW